MPRLSDALRSAIVPSLAIGAAPAAAQVQGIAGPVSIQHGNFGHAAATVPDVSGDGIPDLVVAAKDHPNPIFIILFGNPPVSPQQYGRVFVFSGANGAYLRTIVAPAPDTGFGQSVAGVPDVNGDGRGEIAIGAPEIVTWSASPKFGRIHLYSGATGQLIRTIEPPDAAVARTIGRSMAGIGDVDGDGRGDLVAGAIAGYVPSPTATVFPVALNNKVVVFSGATGAAIRTIDVSFAVGSTEGTTLPVASIPDLNGDNTPEFMVGSYGKVQVYSGADGALIRTITGFPNAHGFGWSLAAVPDADGDATPDIVIGAPFSDLPFIPAGPGDVGVPALEGGRAYLFSGATGALLRSFKGPQTYYNRFGWSVTGLSDLNGDGRGDLAIGAPINIDRGPGTGFGPGQVFIYSGATGQRLRTVNSPNLQNGGRFGHVLLSLPDTNGNGRGELFVTAPFEDPGVQPTIGDKGKGYFVRP